MPTYLVKWKPEIGWAAFIIGVSGILGTLLVSLGVDAKVVLAVVTAVSGIARLAAGAALPTPTESEAVQSVRENLPDDKRGQ